MNESKAMRKIEFTELFYDGSKWKELKRQTLDFESVYSISRQPFETDKFLLTLREGISLKVKNDFTVG